MGSGPVWASDRRIFDRGARRRRVKQENLLFSHDPLVSDEECDLDVYGLMVAG